MFDMVEIIGVSVVSIALPIFNPLLTVLPAIIPFVVAYGVVVRGAVVGRAVVGRAVV